MIGPKRDGRGNEQKLQAVSVWQIAEAGCVDGSMAGSDGKDKSDVEVVLAVAEVRGS